MQAAVTQGVEGRPPLRIVVEVIGDGRGSAPTMTEETTIQMTSSAAEQAKERGGSEDQEAPAEVVAPAVVADRVVREEAVVGRLTRAATAPTVGTQPAMTAVGLAGCWASLWTTTGIWLDS